MASTRPAGDQALIQIVDAALADATTRAGNWLVCAPSCAQCCHGVFAISALDALRLRDGLTALESSDSARASRVRERALKSLETLQAAFPGDPVSGILTETPEAEAAFASYGDDAPCPALDPETGTCDLYAARPMTCRVFGPPVLSAGGLGMCELCFVGAADEEIVGATMQLDHAELEEVLTAEAERVTRAGSTIVAFALCR